MWFFGDYLVFQWVLCRVIFGEVFLMVFDCVFIQFYFQKMFDKVQQRWFLNCFEVFDNRIYGKRIVRGEKQSFLVSLDLDINGFLVGMSWVWLRRQGFLSSFVGVFFIVFFLLLLFILRGICGIFQFKRRRLDEMFKVYFDF